MEKTTKIILGISAVLVVLIIITVSSKRSDFSNSSSYSYGYSNSNSSYSSYESPSEALSDKEADALRGTGFHNTRPNSSAEDMEINAAQVKCGNCGKHSDNGSNSTCDSCRAKGIY